MSMNLATYWIRSFQSLAIALVLLLSTSVYAGDPFKGGDLYGTHCKNCHGSDGNGSLMGAPDFSRGEGLMRMDSDLLQSVLTGKAMMPAYKGLLTDEEILDIITYIRTFER